MNWIEVLAILVGNAAIIIPLWLHLESKISKQDEKFDRFREMWAKESKEFYSKWADESRDYHARLYNLEERYKIKHH